jgi:hypothetical protein
MADPPAEQATKRPRRATLADLEALRHQHDNDVAALLRATARAEHAERLLALAVNALSQWREDDGDMAAPAANALAAIVADVLGLDPDHRGPRIRREVAPWPYGHPDDDEPPIEP